MSVAGTAMVAEEGRTPSYSFALEYEGPRISHHDLPRAVPIDIRNIPVAAVVPKSRFSDNTGKHSMPIVQPILAFDIATNFAKLGITETIISPTSVITFRDDENCNGTDSVSKDLGLGTETETTVSLAHDSGFEERSSRN
ncbi:hypothetical protein L2E82_16053 [Cichorium intybus]|uniref:Uncharacterized protein n=1 Tax=Cichorium intybus TaxID=13427 RepID=A0ACB9F4H9_CICIN|nr:hypothetical protein L2E82_16053 [Cichorium intybus]